MLILGIDPGLEHTGWGLITSVGNRLSHVANGTVNTKPSQPAAERLALIAAGLNAVLAQYKPQHAAVEEVIVNTNARTSLKLGQARGVCLLIPQQHGVQVAEYAARLVKKSLTGTGAADKEQVAHMVKVLLPTANPHSADAADALAVAITHAHHLHFTSSISKLK